MKTGKLARVIGYEYEDSHDFKIGDIVGFVMLSKRDESWYVFENEEGHFQNLIPEEFEWLEEE